MVKCLGRFLEGYVEGKVFDVCRVFRTVFGKARVVLGGDGCGGGVLRVFFSVYRVFLDWCNVGRICVFDFRKGGVFWWV